MIFKMTTYSLKALVITSLFSIPCFAMDMGEKQLPNPLTLQIEAREHSELSTSIEMNSVLFMEHIKLDTCGTFKRLPVDVLEHITTVSPFDVRVLNKTFYFISSGYPTPQNMGLDHLPLMPYTFIGNPRWTASLTFNTKILETINDIPSAVWYRLIKEVKNIPVEFMPKLQGTRIHTLNFWGAGLKSADAKKLSLKGFPLYSLDLSNNYLGSAGVIELPLQDTSLQVLILKHNNIGNRGARGLFLEGTDIHTLDLSHNNIGDSGAKSLPLLNTKIHTVYLAGNRISLKAQRHLLTTYPHITFKFSLRS
jgi:hypothetical protein